MRSLAAESPDEWSGRVQPLIPDILRIRSRVCGAVTARGGKRRLSLEVGEGVNAAIRKSEFAKRAVLRPIVCGPKAAGPTPFAGI